jgi:hypothetical protein
VTYLFYELQRRYRVGEELHRLTPVVLVAQEVPRPHEIDDDWLVAHDWILRRVILDGSFLPALACLATRAVGDEFALEEMRKNVEAQRGIAEALREELVAYRAQTGRRYAALERAVERQAEIAGGEATEGLAERAWEFFSGSGDEESAEAARVREEAAQDAYEKAAREERDMQARLEGEVSALAAATEAYTRALREHLDRRAQIARLRLHVKQNILYYMQAIWSHEPPDQRFFRLHKVRVPRLSGARTYRLEPDPAARAIFPPRAVPVRVIARCQIPPPAAPDLAFTTLAEVADIDSPLGFKGNYMIFPLRESNDLTDFMMTPYLDARTGLRDPDEYGAWTLEDFAAYLCCLREKLKDKPEEFEALKPDLREVYRQLLTNPRRGEDELVVPTGSLYIEALPGVHPILEDFKLLHRAVDVKKVEAEVRAAELENVRAAARLLAGEREDPNIEKKVVVSGASGVTISTGDS